MEQNIENLPIGCVGFMASTILANQINELPKASGGHLLEKLESRNAEVFLIVYKRTKSERVYYITTYISGRTKLVYDFGANMENALAFYDKLTDDFIAEVKRITPIIIESEKKEIEYDKR